MMHQISEYLNGYEHYFTPYYGDGYIRFLTEIGFLDFSILGGRFRQRTEEYLRAKNLKIDYRGEQNNYDLVFTCVDLIIPKNIKKSKVILVQEGMTDPETLKYYLVKYLRLPRYLASTSMTGLSNAYDYFCVASEGYKELFVKKGVKEEKLIVTGIPNFDNIEKYRGNNFPYKDYVLVITSDMRETFKYENRRRFILYAKKIAGKDQLIFKLHPNENIQRATKEINKYAPGALVFSEGNIYHMVANCHTLVSRYSSVVHMANVLGKKIYCDIDRLVLEKLKPLQNGGLSAKNIARIAKKIIEKGSTRKIVIN
ncbi:MAG: hypothetical protein ACM34K_17365 [Bacillota bacterium]